MAFVLLIDDDMATVQGLQPALAREGYQVEHALPGPLALRKALLDEPDLVILGIRPNEREWQFLRRVVSVLDSPLFLLVSNAVEMDRVRGLDWGADDCMLKPAPAVEVLARVRALLRRDGTGVSWRRRSFYSDGELTVDLTRQVAQRDNEPVALTAIEFRLLACLVLNAGQVVPHERLVAEVWGPGYEGSHELVKQHIYQLRRKVERDPSRPCRIVSRRGEGYVLRRAAGE